MFGLLTSTRSQWESLQGDFLPTKAIKIIMLHRLHDILDNVDCIHPSLFTADATNANTAH